MKADKLNPPFLASRSPFRFTLGSIVRFVFTFFIGEHCMRIYYAFKYKLKS